MSCLLDISRIMGDNIFEKFSPRVDQNFVNMKIFENDTLYIISNNIDDLGFDEEKFKIVNKAISYASYVTMAGISHFLSYDKVIPFLKIAKREIDSEDENNELTGI